MLLVLFMLAALLPAADAAENGGLVELVFTGANMQSGFLTLLDGDGNAVLPLRDAESAFLLAPGIYSYYYIDPAGASVPVTALDLNGMSGRVEIALGTEETPEETLEETPAATDAPLPGENAGEAMPVSFCCERSLNYEGLVVTDENGAVMHPYVEPLTETVQYNNYLLPPGDYSYRFQDPYRRLADQAGSFTVTESGMQTVTLTFPEEVRGLCFSATAVNPCYADVIRAESIPKPSVSPEETLEELEQLEALAEQGQSMRRVYFGQAPDVNEGQPADISTPIIYDSAEAAGAALKRSLLQRQAEIAIRLKSDVQPTRESWWSLCRLIYDTAIRHSGAPTEGDYLRYEYGGMNCNGSAAETGESGVYYYSFRYAPLYFTTLAQEVELTARVSQVLNELAPAGKSDEQKIRAVYQYLCDHVRFEEGDGTLAFTAYDALVNGKAVCQGVAVAFYRLCLELGLDTRIVTSSSLGHAWNIVRADGRRYYAADATWDAGKAPEAWEFYLKGRLSWREKHTLGDEFENGKYADYLFPEEDYGSGTDAVIRSVSLLFDGLLRIKYYFVLPESLRQTPGAFVQFCRSGEEIARIPLNEARAEGECSCFYCSVSVEEIDAPIQVRIALDEGSFVPIRSVSGTSYPNGFFFSPMEYARQMKESASTPEMRALAQALEDYGIAAQNYFKKEHGALRGAVTAVRAEDLDAWTTRTAGQKPAGFNGASISVMFEADNSMRLYLHFDGGNERRYLYEIDGQSAVLHRKDDGVFYLSVDNIAADALDTVHRFTVSDGGQTYSVTTSVLGYARTAIERGEENMANLGRALYLYNRAAEAYFGA